MTGTPVTSREKKVFLASGILFIFTAFWLRGNTQNLLAPLVSMEAISYYSIYGATALVGFLAFPFTLAVSSKRNGRRSAEVFASRSWAGSLGAFWFFAMGVVTTFSILALIVHTQPSQTSFGDRSFVPGLVLSSFTALWCSIAILLGRILSLWIAGPIVLLLPYILTVWSVQVQFEQPWTSNWLLTYSVLPQFSVENSINWTPIIASSLTYFGLATAIISITFFAVTKRHRVFTGGLVILGLALPLQVLPNVMESPLIYRSLSEVECRSGFVTVCYWPEIASAYPTQSESLERMILKYQEFGLTPVSKVGILRESDDTSNLKLAPIYSEKTNVLAKTLATNLIVNDNCPLAIDPAGKFVTPMQAQIALTILLGAEPLEVAPRIEFGSEDPKMPDRILSAGESLDYFGLQNISSVRAVFSKWSSQPEGTCAE